MKRLKIWAITGSRCLALSFAICTVGCTQVSPPPPVTGAQASVASRQTAKLVSITCTPNYGRPKAEMSFVNSGNGPIEYGKVFVRFGSKVYDTYLDVTSLPPGSRSGATVFAEDGDSAACEFDSLQDRHGNPLNVSR